MNAIQFIKQHGINKTKRITEEAGYKHHYYSPTKRMWMMFYEEQANPVSLLELKRLVESVDLVNLKGGVKKIKKEADCLFHNDVEGTALRYEQAIADYEAIYGETL